MDTTHSLDVTRDQADVHSEAAVGDELLTVHDAARFLNVSVSWVYEHTRDDNEDRLPFVKIGKYLRFDRHDLRAYIDAKRESCRRIPHRR
jgi:excisionase family DNA binding protein